MHELLIIGIATVDAIARPVDAFPAPGGLRFFDDLAMTTGGCAVNCAVALARLGVPCDVAIRVGRDMLGDFVVSELTRHGVPTRLVARDPARTTSFSFAAVGSGGERSFLHTTGANAALGRADVPASELVGRAFVFVTGTMLMDTLDGDQAAALLADARAAGAKTMLDTVYVESVPPDEWRRRVLPVLPHVDYFVPSHPEANAISGLDDPDQAARAFQDHGARNVVIKLGERGVNYLDAHGHAGRVGAFPVGRVVDATGAGDCWCAGFLAGLREGLPIADAARLGNAVAAYGIQAPGAATGVPTLAKVREFMGRAVT
jgi:sugar/nucleoside kinase (ribokinase family)